MVPSTGQGLNIGLEDAAALVQLFREIPAQRYEALFKMYDKARIERVRAVSKAARDVANNLKAGSAAKARFGRFMMRLVFAIFSYFGVTDATVNYDFRNDVKRAIEEVDGDDDRLGPRPARLPPQQQQLMQQQGSQPSPQLMQPSPRAPPQLMQQQQYAYQAPPPPLQQQQQQYSYQQPQQPMMLPPQQHQQQPAQYAYQPHALQQIQQFSQQQQPPQQQRAYQYQSQPQLHMDSTPPPLSAQSSSTLQQQYLYQSQPQLQQVPPVQT
ncbi:hypothetical protein HK405_002122, partial [Cladochytrium tenue]